MTGLAFIVPTRLRRAAAPSSKSTADKIEQVTISEMRRVGLVLL